MTDTETTKVRDESADQKYFTITPRLVWALARNPFDYTLWSTIKSIAGENGECFLSTADLASLAMMSVGQVHDSRQYWTNCGMLKGEKRRDPGYQQEVWHISIPNTWKTNIEWSEQMPSLKDRVVFKRKQREELSTERKRRKKALHQVKPSPGERQPSSGEGNPSPGELKNIQVKNNQEEPLGADAPERGMTNPNSGRRTDAPVQGDPMTGILHFAALGRGRELDDAVQAYPADVQQTLRWMVEIWRWPVAAIPSKPEKGGKGGQYAQWINELREINRLIDGHGRPALQACVKPCSQITVSHPAAITWALPGVIGQLSAQKDHTPTESAFERGLREDPEAGRRFAEYRANLRNSQA